MGHASGGQQVGRIMLLLWEILIVAMLTYGKGALADHINCWISTWIDLVWPHYLGGPQNVVNLNITCCDGGGSGGSGDLHPRRLFACGVPSLIHSSTVP